VSTLYTIGHSTRPLEDLIEALQAHEIRTLVDIRAFPMSRRLPQFNRESLGKNLPATGIRYVWMNALGGYRKKIREDSPNIAPRNASYRNYADYMLTPEFESAMAEVIALAEASCTAYMCAERYTSAATACLSPTGWSRTDMRYCTLTAAGPVKPHSLTKEARMADGELIYRGDRLL
jgi:uncharacterized protein (DUF488 family)